MADQVPITFELSEIAKLMVKQRGLHEGKWMLGFEFGMGGANMGPNPAELRPAAFIQINKLVLIQPPQGFPAESPLVVDAEIVNPAKKKPAHAAVAARPAKTHRPARAARPRTTEK